MWYKFSKQDTPKPGSEINLNGFYDQQEMGKFLNSPIKPVQKIEQLADSGLENMLDPTRTDKAQFAFALPNATLPSLILTAHLLLNSGSAIL